MTVYAITSMEWEDQISTIQTSIMIIMECIGIHKVINIVILSIDLNSK
jgi:hypothetical protein